MTHVHHKIPRSRGGTDDEWNLVEVDPYTHAYEHALDFVLFEHAPRFDFRHEAWGLLPTDLREAVLSKVSQKMSAENPMFREDARQKLSEKVSGENNPMFGKPGTLLGVTGENHPSYGRQLSEETLQKTSGENHWGFGKTRTKSVKEKISKTLSGKPWSPARRKAYEDRWGSK